MNKNMLGHSLALFTVFLWGMTFISTKLLLTHGFTPLEILFYRFIMGAAALYIIFPKRLKGTTLKQEMTFAAAGVCGITLYYLLENIALTYTNASNVALLAALAPFFTIILSHWFLKEEEIKPSFIFGFFISIIGIALISFNGVTQFELNPLGDGLALGAALVWAFYSIFTKKISGFGYSTIQTTRRTFTYGLFFMLFATLFFDFQWKPDEFFKPENLFHFLFLGLGASALCFVSWNISLRLIGAVKSSMYIYLAPIITVIAAVIILKEPINWVSGIGILLTLLGLVASKINWRKRKR